jgi:HAMP domain-containing protein
MRRFGLRYQLTGWFLLIGVVPAAAVSAYAYSVTRTGLFREAGALMRADADAAIDRLDESFGVVRDQLALAARQVAQRVLEAKAKQPPRPRSKTPPRVNFDPAVSVLVSWGQRAPVPVETWTVVDAQAEPRLAFVDGQPGAFGAFSDNDRNLAAAAQAAPDGEVVFGGVVTSAQTARRVLTFATKIIGGDGVTLGSLHGEIPAEWFQRALEVRATRGGSLWVFDHARHLVLTTDAKPDAEDVAPTLSATGAGGGDRPARVQIGPDAVAVIMSPLSVAGSREPWTVAVSVPEQTIAGQAHPWRYVTVVAALAGAVGLFAALVSGRITRPITTLEEGARRIAQGDLQFDLQVRGRNELERLAGSFLEMAYGLKRAQERLTKAERMAAIGEVSLAIEHEVHQSLTTVMAAAERLKARPDLPEPVREQVTSIYEAAVRMRDVLQQLERVHDQTKEPARGPRMIDVAATRGPGREAGGAA